MALEGIHYIEGRDGLAARVARVLDRVADNIFQKDEHDPPRLLVNQPRNALDTTTAGEAANNGLGDALNVVS